MFDRSFLPPARYEFVVVADTHYMLDTTGQHVEFTSRRRQTARAEHALRTVAGLGDLPVIHMGDLVQEFPERPGFVQAVDEALAQLAACGVAPRQVAGNHDVGDKPDPTMPADWVTPAWLDNYQRRFGPSWRSWDAGDLHFVVLNSQILNSGLDAEAEQAAWLEEDLRAHTDRRIFLFLHLPPYLYSPDEIGLGHYDNIDQPARRWLLDLVRVHRVEMLFAAHIHWAFYNEIRSSTFDQSHTSESRTSYFTVPSTSFTRPGFSEMFSSPPPPEQGRDDTGKLGFFLVRVMDEGSRVHFIRTGGATGAPEPRPRLLTRTSADLADSPLGLVLHHPLTRQVEVPSAWPSAVRQPVRNDYPLLTATELGAAHALVAAADLGDPLQRERLEILRRQGVRVTARQLWRPGVSLLDGATAAGCDGLQIDVLGAPVPDAELAEALRAWQRTSGLPVTLSCVIPNWAVPGKQHNRSQIGFLPGQLAGLGEWLDANGLTVERALCRLDASGAGGTILEQVAGTIRPPAIGALDWIVEFPALATGRRLAAGAEALFALLSRPGSRLYVEPFVELDRTMDVAEGLLDRRCNPTPLFDLLRNLNTLLFSRPERRGVIAAQERADGRTLTCQVGSADYRLSLANDGVRLTIDDGHAQRVYDVVSGLRLDG